MSPSKGMRDKFEEQRKGAKTRISVFDFFRESITQLTSQTKSQGSESQIQDIDFDLVSSMQGFSNYLRMGEPLELVDGENLRIHDEELTILMSDYIE